MRLRLGLISPILIAVIATVAFLTAGEDPISPPSFTLLNESPTAVPSPTSRPPLQSTPTEAQAIHQGPIPTATPRTDDREATPTVDPTATTRSLATPTAQDATVVESAGAFTPGTATPIPTQTTAPATPTPPRPTPVPIAPPVRLEIPKIHVDTAIEYVGKDENGNMGSPKEYSNVAWYEPGFLPGAPGNAVMAGHLDSKTGPAIFWKLSDLQPGDEIFVTTAEGKRFRFVADRFEAYPADEAPLDDIFGASTASHLNLITCEGSFSLEAQQYDQRLVVYATLAS